MAEELTLEILENYVGKDIGVLANDYFNDIKYGRRNTQASRAVRDLGYSVSNNGLIYRGARKRDAFEILEDSNGRPYVKLSGLIRRGGRTGLTGLFFPSKFKKEWMISLRSWGKSGLNLYGVKTKDVEVTPNGVRIHVDYIEIVPDRKFLPRFLEWIKSIKLPLRDEENE